MGIATTPFRRFNAPDGDPLTRAFRCNGNAQCLSYAETTPMCPSFKATADVRHSPKGRADALREWHRSRDPALERDLLGVLDTCLGCKACASSCPVQVDIPTMRSAFYADHYGRHARPLADRLTLLAERFSPALLAVQPAVAPFWPLAVRLAQPALRLVDLQDRLARPVPRRYRLRSRDLAALPDRSVILVQDWFTALFDYRLQRDMIAGFEALGFRPRMLPMRPAGKAAQNSGDMDGVQRMGTRLVALLNAAAASGHPLVGMDPAFVTQLRQDYPKAGLTPPPVQMPQEFLATCDLPSAVGAAPARLMMHCTEASAHPNAAKGWAEVFAALGIPVETPATGCCGMAGLFGHQQRHQTVSRTLFDMSWRQVVGEGAHVAATGYSCRCQSERLTGRAVRHPMGLIADRFA